MCAPNMSAIVSNFIWKNKLPETAGNKDAKAERTLRAYVLLLRIGQFGFQRLGVPAFAAASGIRVRALRKEQT